LTVKERRLVTKDQTLGLSAIGQIAYVVRNIEAATSFYRDQLGLSFLFTAPPKLAFFDLAGIRLMLAEPENPAETNKVGANSTLYFKVQDIEATFAAISQRGVAVVNKPHRIATLGDVELWMAFFSDPDANLIGIIAEVPVQS
jgi:predicted enzyme related to lactoylglutathione lyase